MFETRPAAPGLGKAAVIHIALALGRGRTVLALDGGAIVAVDDEGRAAWALVKATARVAAMRVVRNMVVSPGF